MFVWKRIELYLFIYLKKMDGRWKEEVEGGGGWWIGGNRDDIKRRELTEIRGAIRLSLENYGFLYLQLATLVTFPKRRLTVVLVRNQ